LLAAESGCNEGAALLFLFFALYLMVDSPNVGTAMKDWFLIVWLCKFFFCHRLPPLICPDEIALAIVIGSVLGFSFRHLMKFSQRHDLINRQSYVAQFLSLAMLTVGITTILGTDDLLAAFVCGTAFSWDGFYHKQTKETVFSSVIDGLFNVAAFIFVGAWMPFNKFLINMSGSSGTGLEVWRLAVLALLIFLLRRLPIMMGLYRWIPDLRTWREAAMYGHFGPMGITAIFMSTLGNQFLRRHMESLPSPPTGSNYQQFLILTDTIEPIIAFVVLCSIIIHGLSIPGFSLGKRVHSISRTWSRKDTVGNGRPDWTNRTKLITKVEDVIINRDLEKGVVNGVPLERTITVISTRAPSYADAKEDKLKEDTMIEEVKLLVPASITPSRQTAVDQDHLRQFPPNGELHQTSEDQRAPENGSDGFEDDVCWPFPLPLSI
jgi:sodium/hydrogen antiporter